jgi:phosphate transport system permease protein
MDLKYKIERIVDHHISKLLLLAAFFSVLALFLIILFLFNEGFRVFNYTDIKSFFLGEFWYPTSSPHQFGVLPLILGTLLVTFVSIVIAVPISVAAAIYLAEIAPGYIRDILKPAIELLAGIPSVVFGFFGLVILIPAIQKAFDLPTGSTALAGSLMLAIVALPTIVSVSEDAISSVPSSYREASFAMGATHLQTIIRVLVPASASGIITAVILGAGRIVGETMVVLMVTGNAAVIPSSIFEPVRTMTATIAIEMGEAVQGGDHYYALFAIGAVLFVMTLVMNFIADALTSKWRKIKE